MVSKEINVNESRNPMTKPKIDKVVVNVSIGKSGEPLDRATRILLELTGQKPAIRKAKKTIRDFGIRKKEPIACIVTLRKEKAMEFLKRSFQAVDNKILAKSFDENGNFSFGIREHIDIPGTKYSPDLGIIGMNVCVSLHKPGYRVKLRRVGASTIGAAHMLTRDEAVTFVSGELGIQVT